MSNKPMETPGDLANKQHIRVYTFGRLQIVWVDQQGKRTPLPAERLRGQNAASSLGLLKALLTRPDRFATRAWLLEQFWPNSRHRSAEERLTDVVSSLRGLLRPVGSSDMLVHFVYGANGRGVGFRLDAFPHLWCDADAFEWYVTHAILLDQRDQDATACWERAFALAERGSYLPEQVEDDWTRPRRDHLYGLLRDCVQRWTQVLRQAGQGDEALMHLRSYWLTHPTDEDALRPLLDLLGERDRFQEAEECYAKARAALAEDGQALDARTDEAMEAVRALSVQRIPHHVPARSVIPWTEPPALLSRELSPKATDPHHPALPAFPALFPEQQCSLPPPTAFAHLASLEIPPEDGVARLSIIVSHLLSLPYQWSNAPIS